jgi:hypothetical protein
VRPEGLNDCDTVADVVDCCCGGPFGLSLGSGKEESISVEVSEGESVAVVEDELAA